MEKHILRKDLLSIFFSFLGSISLFSQKAELTFLGGITNYMGDLQAGKFSVPNARTVLGVAYKYPVSSKFWIRGAVSQGKISAADANNPDYLRARNLSFESKVTDGYLALEYRLFTEEKSAIIPFVFAGVGMFGFNPYAYYGNSKSEKVYLRDLGTEGQGLPEYPDREMYDLTQVMIPFGAGLLWHATPRWTFGVEFRNNFTFTDYLDDVSGGYAQEAALLRDRGQLAVDMAWRRDEFDNAPYPTNVNQVRGNPDKDDWYYNLNLFIAMKLPTFKGNRSDPGKNKLDCPKW